MNRVLDTLKSFKGTRIVGYELCTNWKITCRVAGNYTVSHIHMFTYNRRSFRKKADGFGMRARRQRKSTWHRTHFAVKVPGKWCHNKSILNDNLKRKKSWTLANLRYQHQSPISTPRKSGKVYVLLQLGSLLATYDQVQLWFWRKQTIYWQKTS